MSEQKVTVISNPCPRCGSVEVFELDFERVKRWRGGELIQNAFPELGVDQRERLISGTCPECWDAMFKE